MKRKNMYLLLCVAGTVLPYWFFVPWLYQHGLDARLMLEELFVNRISSFFATDVIVSSVVVIGFVFSERSRLAGKWWLPVVAVLTVGVSLGLPLVLYLRETAVEPVISS